MLRQKNLNRDFYKICKMNKIKFCQFPNLAKIKVQTIVKESDLSSRSREFHSQPLTEPYVKLSVHTALRNRTLDFTFNK